MRRPAGCSVASTQISTAAKSSASVRAIARRFAEKGSDAWFQESPADLLSHYDAAKDPHAPKGLDVGALTKLWLEGQSSSQIAKQLGGGVTRNAVIGKVHRLGLSGRAAPSQPARAR